MARILISLIFLFLLSVSYGASDKPPAAKPNSVQFKRLVDSTITAIEQEDFDKLQFLFTGVQPIIVLGNHRFTELASLQNYWREHLLQSVIGIKTLKIKPVGELIVQYVAKKIVLISSVARVSVHYNNQDQRLQMLYCSAVAKSEQDGWKMLSIHCSIDEKVSPSRLHTYHIAGIAMLLGLALGAALLAALRRLDSGVADA